MESTANASAILSKKPKIRRKRLNWRNVKYRKRKRQEQRIQMMLSEKSKQHDNHDEAFRDVFPKPEYFNQSDDVEVEIEDVKPMPFLHIPQSSLAYLDHSYSLIHVPENIKDIAQEQSDSNNYFTSPIKMSPRSVADCQPESRNFVGIQAMFSDTSDFAGVDETVSSEIRVDSSDKSSRSTRAQTRLALNNIATEMSPQKAVVEKLKQLLPLTWIVFERNGVCAMQLPTSDGMCGIIQKSICASLDGGIPKIFVHGVELIEQSVLGDLALDTPPVELVDEFVGTFIEIVRRLRLYEICCGVDDKMYRDFWGTIDDCVVDRNIFQEPRYEETLRSKSCHQLVPRSYRRCSVCSNVVSRLRKRFLRRQNSGGLSANPKGDMDRSQMKARLREKQRVLDACRKKIKRLQDKIQRQDGVNDDQVLQGAEKQKALQECRKKLRFQNKIQRQDGVNGDQVLQGVEKEKASQACRRKSKRFQDKIQRQKGVSDDQVLQGAENGLQDAESDHEDQSMNETDLMQVDLIVL